jgi:archaellum component FlaD/FlaE
MSTARSDLFARKTRLWHDFKYCLLVSVLALGMTAEQVDKLKEEWKADKQQQQLNPDADAPAAGNSAQQQQQQSEDVVVDDKDAQDVLDEAAAAEALVDAAVEEAAAMTKSANSAADGSAGVEDTPQVLCIGGSVIANIVSCFVCVGTKCRIV